MSLSPKICGLWDGCGLWVQWEEAEDEQEQDKEKDKGAAAFELQLRYRAEDDMPWGEWITTVPPQGERSSWGVIPTWKEGWQFQARVRVAPSRDPSSPSAHRDDFRSFEEASEVTFSQCTALFEFSSARYEQHFLPGTIFHAQVDGAACSYQLREAITVRPGESARVRLFATGASGYFQLDRENHFDVKPTFGVRVRNVEASVEDFEETGRDFTVIAPKAQPDMVTMTVTGKTEF